MSDEVKLLGVWGSPFSRRVELALRLKGIAFDYVEEENVYGNKSTLLLESNPIYKKIPVLFHGGKPLAESLIIIEYINENWSGGRPLLPKDPFERAKARFLAKFIDDKESNIDGEFNKIEMKSKFLTIILNDIMRMMAAKMFLDKKEQVSSESNEEEVFRDWVEDVFSILGGRTNIADYLPFLGWLNLNGWKKKVASIAEYRDEFFQKLLEDIRRSSTDEQKKKTIMATMISLQKTDPKYYTDEIIKGFSITMLTAGTDTSSNTIEWALTLLLNNPDKLKKLQAEIDEKIGSERLVQESDVQNLPYLQCVINETLRLKPAGPLMVPHEASENCVVGGYNIPKGTMLLVNAYRIHRDPDTWVEPLKFEPERFQSGKHDISKMLIFGMGRMKCPGEILARRMVGSVLGSVVQCFDWKRTGEEMIDMTESVAITMGKQIPLEAMYRPREHMKSVMMKL